MGSIGGAEIFVIIIVALVVLGPTRLPDAARQVGRALAEFRRISSGFQAEVRDAFVEPTVMKPQSGTMPAPPSANVTVDPPPQIDPAPGAGPDPRSAPGGDASAPVPGSEPTA